MFLTNMVYMTLFAYSWVFWLNTSSWSYSEDWLNTVFAFTLIINLCLSIFNLYSMCLVYKFGCCFMNGVDRECPQQSVNMMVVNHSQLNTIGGGVPANGSGLTMPIGPQQGQFRTGTSFPQQQPYITNMPLSLQPAQQQQPAGGATAESASLSIPHSITPDTSGQNEAPPSYPEAVFNSKHSSA
ncbi:uncharacterized protein LOC128203710 [Mya arenaria]|uniref:uncharacterized protein LOC128203710 n=1 Tax=Mya arenaria TaxID=6604 RepID=UPI0022E741AB|nr:uncharacterized protein LOC128203710 [Mya arenaria]